MNSEFSTYVYLVLCLTLALLYVKTCVFKSFGQPTIYLILNLFLFLKIMPKRDKDKPKGKTSAYAYFVQDQKELLKSRGESLDFSAFSKSCSEEWKKVKDKTKFVKKAETDKERYEREMEDYIPASDSKDAKKSKKKTKDVNAPKRAL